MGVGALDKGIARCTFPLLPCGRNAAKAAPEIYKALNPKAGIKSIASAPAVISTFGSDLIRIPDRSLTASLALFGSRLKSIRNDKEKRQV